MNTFTDCILMMLKKLLVTVFAFSFSANSTEPVVKRIGEKLFDVNYKHIRAIVDCNMRTAILVKADVKWNVISQKAPRISTSIRSYETNIPFECNPVSDTGYASTNTSIDYRSMSLMPAALLGPDEVINTIKMPFTIPMTRQSSMVVNNVVMRIACKAKTTSGVRVFAGPIYTRYRSHDFFYSTHGQLTPNAYFIVATTEDGDLMSLLIPNHKRATLDALKTWLKPINSIELLTSVSIPVKLSAKQRYPSLWSAQCNLT
jgi:hypothetical protein